MGTCALLSYKTFLTGCDWAYRILSDALVF